MKNFTKTKIIATLGPATDSPGEIIELLNAGVRVFRINSSHGNQKEHLERIKNIRQAAAGLNLHIPIILDLQGPKIRIGNLKKPIELKKGGNIVFKACPTQEEDEIIPVDYCDIGQDLKEDDIILLDDGKLRLKVLKIKEGQIETLVINGGILTSRKGMNIPGALIHVPSITQKDIGYIKFAVDNEVDYIALSFVRTKQDIIQAKEYIKQTGGDIPVIAKIEKPDAVKNLSEIMSVSDGIMVARGDLGVEISPQKVPVVQKHMIKESNFMRKEVITATQMLESMIYEPTPTRAEASDVANAIIDGTDAVMLSGETAVGKFPVETVKIMKSIAEDVENSDLCKYNTYETKNSCNYDGDSRFIANSAISMLDEADITAIIAFTRSGFTAKLISKAKPSVPIVAISDNVQVCRKLNLLWGVFPFYMEFSSNFTEELLKKADDFLVNNTFLKKGDKIVITGGMPCMAVGTTNFIRIHKIGSI